MENFLEASRFSKPVYMITGLKIGHGVRAKSRMASDAEGHASADISPGMALGGQVSFGGEIAGSSRQVTSDRFEGSTSIVVGYRLRKITCGRTMDITHEEENSGAFLGVDYKEKDRSYAVKSIGREDAAADELDSIEMTIAVDDYDGKECQCFLVRK